MERRGSITPAQESAAKISARRKSIKRLRKVAREFAKTEHSSLHGRREFRNNVKTQLIDLYVASVSSPTETMHDVVQAVKKPQQETKVEREFRRVSPKLRRIEKDALDHASGLGVIRRGINTAETIVFMNGFPEQIGKEVLRSAGYSKAESKLIRDKLATASVLDLVTTAAAWIGVGVAVTAETVSNVVPNITDAKVIYSYLALYGSTALVALTNKLLLDNSAVKTCANAFAAAGYYFTPKITEKWKKAAGWTGTTVGSFAPNLIGELTTWGVIGAFAGREGVFARNAASTAIELATVVGNLGWLAYGKRKEGQS